MSAPIPNPSSKEVVILDEQQRNSIGRKWGRQDTQLRLIFAMKGLIPPTGLRAQALLLRNALWALRNSGRSRRQQIAHRSAAGLEGSRHIFPGPEAKSARSETGAFRKRPR